jgi:hypothetical protein
VNGGSTSGRWQRLGTALSLDHHGQLFGLIILYAVSASLQSGWMLIGALQYTLMHFMYGGSGTFQRPARLGKAEGAIDMILVLNGIAGILLFLFGLLDGLLRLFA